MINQWNNYHRTQGMVMVDNREEMENFLIDRIEKCTAILEGLENNSSFNMLLEDFKRQASDIDSSWHLQTDLNKLNEMRVGKFAAIALITALDNYKYDLSKSTEQLGKLRGIEEDEE